MTETDEGEEIGAHRAARTMRRGSGEGSEDGEEKKSGRASETGTGIERPTSAGERTDTKSMRTLIGKASGEKGELCRLHSTGKQ